MRVRPLAWRINVGQVALQGLLTDMDIEGPRAGEELMLTKWLKFGAAGGHTRSPEGREGGVNRSNRAHAHTTRSACVRRVRGTAGEPHAGSNRCASPEGELASGSDGSRLLWIRSGRGLLLYLRAAASQLEGTATQSVRH